MSEYYKSLISDDEVIKELIKESKRREGTLPTIDGSRLKPNLKFFHRTVNHLLSSNTRIDKSIETFRSDYKKHRNVAKYKRSKHKYESRKPYTDYKAERKYVKERRIHFVRSQEDSPYINYLKDTEEKDNNPNLRKIIDELSTDSGDSDEDCEPVTCKVLPNAKHKGSNLDSSKDKEGTILLSSDDEILLDEPENNKRKIKARSRYR